MRSLLGPFDDGKASTSVAFHWICFAFWEVDASIIFVAFGLPDGDGLGKIECVQKALQVGGILPSCIDANMKLDVIVPLRELAESLTQLIISFLRFTEPKRFGGELKVLSEEGDVMSISTGIKTNTDGQR